MSQNLPSTSLGPVRAPAEPIAFGHYGNMPLIHPRAAIAIASKSDAQAFFRYSGSYSRIYTRDGKVFDNQEAFMEWYNASR